jgi:glycosyltransferase involved in cell wall biosynthesis
MHSKSLHALLIHQVFATSNDPGGTRHFELGKRLVGMGHQVTVVTSGANYITGEQTSASSDSGGLKILRCFALDGLHKSYLRRTAVFVSFMLTSVLRAVCVRKVDVVIATSPPLFQALSAWIVAVLKRRPLLLEIRDLWPQFAIELGVLRNSALIGIARWAEAFLYRRADHIIVNSPGYREYLMHAGVDPQKISLIANGVDAAMYPAGDDGECIRKERGWAQKFVVMYAGALGLANDIDVLLRAANRLQERSEIVLCGG